MSTDIRSQEKVVWGIPVEILPSGRFAWPEEVKRLAVSKVLIEGRTSGSIARELGANANVIGRWVSEARKTRSNTPEPPHFAKVEITDDTQTDTTPLTPPARSFRVICGEAQLELSVDLDDATIVRLVKLLQGL